MCDETIRILNLPVFDIFIEYFFDTSDSLKSKVIPLITILDPEPMVHSGEV